MLADERAVEDYCRAVQAQVEEAVECVECSVRGCNNESLGARGAELADLCATHADAEFRIRPDSCPIYSGACDAPEDAGA